MIEARLEQIFPVALDRRSWLTGRAAARSIYTMFYVGAVEGAERWIRPSHVYRMTEQQAMLLSDGDRRDYHRTITAVGDRWYEDNTRESVRDEFLRTALRLGAVIERPAVPTTSSRPRWGLAHDFAELFILPEQAFTPAADVWRRAHLSAGALARVALAQRGVARSVPGNHVKIHLPDGSVRRLAAGPSSDIAKGVVESLLQDFLEEPVLLWMSDSKRHVVAHDDEFAQQIGLRITDSSILPDIVAVDVASSARVSPIIVFIEIVASEGPVDEGRKSALLSMLAASGFRPDHARFVTAYWDRNTQAYRRTIGHVAWNTAVWFATEPGHLVVAYGEAAGQRLYDLIRQQ